MWRKFWELDFSSRMLLAEAVLALATAETALRVLPFRWIARRLGQSVIESSGYEAIARQVKWMLPAVARHLPWRSRCLAQAIAAQLLLRRRGIPSTLYLGVDHGRERWLDAHAWLRSGDIILTGGPGHRRFKVIATFGENLK